MFCCMHKSVIASFELLIFFFLLFKVAKVPTSEKIIKKKHFYKIKIYYTEKDKLVQEIAAYLQDKSKEIDEKLGSHSNNKALFLWCFCLCSVVFICT